MFCSRDKLIGLIAKQQNDKSSQENSRKEKCLPNKKYTSDHRCERINIAVKCKIFFAVT